MKITFTSKEERINFKSKLTATCDQCGQLSKYSKKYDSWYCSHCNLWLEVACDDPDCEYCKNRPEFPKKINIKRDNDVK